MRCCSLIEDDTRCPNTAVKGYSVCRLHWKGESPPPPKAAKIEAAVKRLRRDVAEMLGDGGRDSDTLLAGMVIIGAIDFRTMDPGKLSGHFRVRRSRVRAIVRRLRECRIWEGKLMDIGSWMEGDNEGVQLVAFILQALAGAGLVIPERQGDLIDENTKWSVV